MPFEPLGPPVTVPSSPSVLTGPLAQRHLARGDDWGRIVSLTSGGPDGFPGEAFYGAAKAALDNSTMSAAADLGGVGITANEADVRGAVLVVSGPPSVGTAHNGQTLLADRPESSRMVTEWSHAT